MGEHPSPGPAVAACAEAERIEELEPEAEERLPAAPEDNVTLGAPATSAQESSGASWRATALSLDPHKKEVLLALADSHADGQICYQDFVNLMSNKRSNSFRQAILQGNRRLSSKALLEEKGLSLSQRLIRHVAYETLPREIDRKWYYDSYTCCPPPWFMITVTLLEVALFLYNGVLLDQFVLQVTHPRYLKNSLVYHPQLRAQAWRYVTYIFMHAGVEQLGLNVVLQLLVGVPLEMVHGATRIGLVYVAGVVAGSLAVSVADMTAPVVGSSGGVYALVSAHLANIVMDRVSLCTPIQSWNSLCRPGWPRTRRSICLCLLSAGIKGNWSGMKCQFKLLRMAVALICMSMEFGRAVWLRFHPSAYPPCPHPSFVAHLGGVAVGITLGVVVLRNYEQRLQDQSLWWIFVTMYTIFVLFAVFWNIFAYTLLDLKLPPPP
ncbi:Rhomboid-related protein 3 [Apodemus speciosus]|uniref:rhomboid protease n=1 Tax=Apodemus speciosus TaxID=105296 RepID=A0ABQ0FBN5_APOSI